MRVGGLDRVESLVDSLPALVGSLGAPAESIEAQVFSQMAAITGDSDTKGSSNAGKPRSRARSRERSPIAIEIAANKQSPRKACSMPWTRSCSGMAM
jgi:hypothetical protein